MATGSATQAGHPPARPRMSIHLTVAAALHIGLGAMGVLGGVMLVLSGRGGEAVATSTVLAVLLGMAALLGLIGGVGLLRGAGGARIALLVVSVVYLIDLPFGTALGAYSVWVLLHPATPEALAARRR